MITLPTLYDHQATQVNDVRNAFRRHKGVILCAQTGEGKTREAKHIIGLGVNRGPSKGQSGNFLFTVRRRGLVDNASNSFNEYPVLPHGVIMSGKETSFDRNVQVASIDTLLSWWAEDGQYSGPLTFDMICFDECHAHHSKLATFLKAHRTERRRLGLMPAYVLGLSATPYAKGLCDVYGEIVKGARVDWLIQNGFLVPYRYFEGTKGKLDLLVKQGNGFTRDSNSAAMGGLSGTMVRDWLRLGEGRPTIGFFLRRQHARDAMDELEAAGIDTRYVDGDTSDTIRRSLFYGLGEGHFNYLTNVDVVGRGTDIPRVSCIQLCLGIGSVVQFRQKIGRGSRVHPLKKDCIVIDHADNVHRLGYFEDDVDWTIDATRDTVKDHEARPSITCPKCKAVYRGGKCQMCGYEPTQRERKQQKLQFDGTELQEINRSTHKRGEYSHEKLMVSKLFMAGRAGLTFKAAVAIAGQEAAKKGQKFRVPHKVKIAGQDYYMPEYGSPDGERRVRALFPVTAGR